MSQRIQASGAKVWKTNTSEGDSLYFQDPTGHKLEIHATNWQTRLTAAKTDPEWTDIEFFKLD